MTDNQSKQKPVPNQGQVRNEREMLGIAGARMEQEVAKLDRQQLNNTLLSGVIAGGLGLGSGFLASTEPVTATILGVACFAVVKSGLERQDKMGTREAGFQAAKEMVDIRKAAGGKLEDVLQAVGREENKSKNIDYQSALQQSKNIIQDILDGKDSSSDKGISR